MSNSGLIIPERSRDIGDFLVGRLLPFRRKRMIGPFIFVDHMGPAQLGPEKYLDVGQHPHIGLSTLTYLLEGEIIHKDGLGTEQRIRPGAVNWMTAGRGVTHTERSPEDLRNGKTYTLHGYQIWVALPRELENMPPEFHHLSAEEVPIWEEGKAHFKLIAGKGFGRKSPLPVHSELFMVEIKTEGLTKLALHQHLFGEIGIIVVAGKLHACDQEIEKGNILYAKAADNCNISLEEGSHVLVFGGKPFPEPRNIYWNFVHSEQEQIEAAKKSWKDKTFPMMEGEVSYVPLPK